MKVRAIACLWLALVGSVFPGVVRWAIGQPLGPSDMPQPEAAPVFVQPSPIGDLEYRAGRGLRVGDSGFTIGGFSTLLAEHKEAGGHTHFTLDDQNLFVLFDPTPYFHIFSELGFQNLFDLGDTDEHPEPRDSVAVDRLYADLNLTDRLNVRVGKFFTPFGRWNEIPAEPLLWTASRPLITEGPFDEQVTGAMTWGSFFPTEGALTYKLYGQFTEALDPDNRIPPAHRSAGARLEYSSLAAWGIGSSYLASNRLGRWDHLAGLDGLWRGEHSEVMAEFAAGRGDPAGRHLYGFYIQGVRELIRTLSLVGRYEHFDPGGSLPEANLFDFGLSWRPSAYVVVNLDYLLADRTGGIDHTEQNFPGFRCSLSILF